MTLRKGISILGRTLLVTIMVVLLLVVALLLTLYSGWGQNLVRQKALDYINSQPGMSLRLDYLRIHYPLDLELAGIAFVQQGDTMVTADSLSASVKLAPLFMGRVDVSDARLTNGFYQLGNADSTLWMRIKAADVTLHPASVALGTMDIDVDYGRLRHASVGMVMKQDTTSTASNPSKQTMSIRLGRLDIEDLTYNMSMMPTIDSLGATIGNATMRHGRIDMDKQTIDLRSIVGDHLNAAYIAPDSASIAQYPAMLATDTPQQPQSEPWTIRIDTIGFVESQGLYTTRGVVPAPGLDFAYIQADSLDLNITGFYNQATNIVLPMHLRATERCGIRLDAAGTFSMDSVAMRFDDFNVTADNTYLTVAGMMGIGSIMTDPSLPLSLNANGYIGFGDLALMFPTARPYLSMLPSNGRADLTVGLNGTPSLLNIDKLALAISRTATIEGKGTLTDLTTPKDMGADITLHGRVIDVHGIINSMVDPSMGLAVPPMTMAGNVHMRHGNITGQLKANTLGGDLALDARYNSNTEGFDVNVDADRFPVGAFLPDMAIGDATLSITAHGNGFDLTSAKTNINANADIKSLVYNGYNYQGINLDAKFTDGQAAVSGSVHSHDIDATIDASGNLTGSTYTWIARVDGDNIDLYNLKLSQTPLQLSVNMDADIAYSPGSNNISGSANITNLVYNGDEGIEFTLSDINAHVNANDSLINVDVHNRDLVANATIDTNIERLSTQVNDLMAVLDTQMHDMKFDIDTLQQLMPKFELDVKAGNDNLINDILAAQQMSIRHLSMAVGNSQSLSINTRILSFDTGSMIMDTIGIDMSQSREKLHLIGTVNNRKGNMDEFAHIRMDGLLGSDNLSVRISQSNAANETGYDLGAIASYADSTITARFFPLNPMIGYKRWSVNIDNFLKYNVATKHIDANLKMKGGNSSLALYTDHQHTEGHHEEMDSINNVILRIDDIHLQDWIVFNPFAPPISGDLSANINVNWDGGQNINGAGNLALSNFYYNRQKVATINMDVNVATNMAGIVKANADLMVDGQRALTLSGNLNDKDTESPLNLDMSLIRFPLSIANPFLPEDIAAISGMLNGQMEVSGKSSAPAINGELWFDNAALKLFMTNTSYAFSTVKVPVTDNIVKFNDFNIKGASDNALYVNGTVDIHSLVSPRYDLNMRARDFMLVNSNKAAKNASVYGKAYIDLDASAVGNLDFARVNADLTVLAGTNVNYIMSFTTNDITSASTENLVKFVNLNDSTAVMEADSLTNQSMMMMLDAKLTVQNGTTITVDLPTSSRDKVQVQADGTLTYTQSPISDGRVQGRLNINNGFARYTIPVVGAEKMFSFDQGSYIAFNGNMLNPTLNIHATDVVKANVTQQGQNSRLVNFDILLSVTGTLEQMNVAFDLTTDDDLTVANELQTMSPDQRANQAMNMLLYNMYTGPGTSASANMAGNPLFSFLESQINNWAANNIKGVDLSFGIDQYNQTTNGMTSSTMTYSYQVSKTLFNDRFKILIGGNYTTDNNADENIAENLINDISFEYFLNPQQTMVLRIFRHSGYESILEGEIVQTGVGFVYRKKLNKLVKILPKFMRPKSKNI